MTQAMEQAQAQAASRPARTAAQIAAQQAAIEAGQRAVYSNNLVFCFEMVAQQRCPTPTARQPNPCKV